jgi:hypothetical protein
MQFICDKAGFPVLKLPSLRLEVQLLPVLKMQFERFLPEASGVSDLQYKEMLKLNPRVTHRKATSENREQLLLTGVLPSEAIAFGKWMGPGIDLPTVTEWRMVYRAMEGMAFPVAVALEPIMGKLSKAVKETMRLLPVNSMFDFSLMNGGVVEWARDGNEWVGLGAPRDSFFSNLYQPLQDVVQPISVETRMPHFGFRLVRRTE